jgi:hypothetical protein
VSTSLSCRLCVRDVQNGFVDFDLAVLSSEGVILRFASLRCDSTGDVTEGRFFRCGHRDSSLQKAVGDAMKTGRLLSSVGRDGIAALIAQRAIIGERGAVLSLVVDSGSNPPLPRTHAEWRSFRSPGHIAFLDAWEFYVASTGKVMRAHRYALPHPETGQRCGSVVPNDSGWWSDIQRLGVPCPGLHLSA